MLQPTEMSFRLLHRLRGSRRVCAHQRITRSLLSTLWPTVSQASAAQWIKAQPIEQLKEDFHTHGFATITGLLGSEDIIAYKKLYTDFISGQIDTRQHRHDLGSHENQHVDGSENVTQIMWPSVYIKDLLQGAIHMRTQLVAQYLLGEDMAFDFDMLISKAPHTNTAIPWHQDQAYWPSAPDTRAVSFWVALDEATPENGCMCFLPGSHQTGLRPHEKAKHGHHALSCLDNISEEASICIPLSAGSCTLHHGATLHRTGGNATATWRRAFIVNFRPQSMVDYFRAHGFDHGRQA
eukprot:m.187180 g.187180  ORF g.187180 m.187180 type:complete len:294 (+) comp16709_c0_seq2:18-899(+)